MTYHTVTLNGNNVPYTPGTLEFYSEFGARSAVSLSLVDRTGAVDYQVLMGTEVEIKDPDDVRVFTGILSDPTWNLIMGTEAVAWSLKFSDFTALADRVHIFEYYDSVATPLTSDIVKAIIADHLSQFGVTEGTIEDGSTVSEAVYNGQKASVAIDELAKRDGFLWVIDDDKKLHYRSQTSISAPWNIEASQGRYISMGGSASLSDHVNKVFQRGSTTGISDSRTESCAGDGVRREFKLLYKCHSEVSVKVNGTPATLGILGVESGFDFYWNQDSDIITQDEGGTLLQSTDTLAVTYRAQVSLFVEMEDEADIAERAAAEGTSGVYEALYEDTSAQFLDLTVQAAETRLRQSPFEKADLTYITDFGGLRAGMVQAIEVPRRCIDATFLITSITANELEAQDGRLRYTVRCISGERADDWVDYFRRISEQGSYELRTNEIVSKCRKIEATCEISATASIISAPEWTWGTDSGDSSLWDGGDAWW